MVSSDLVEWRASRFRAPIYYYGGGHLVSAAVVVPRFRSVDPCFRMLLALIVGQGDKDLVEVTVDTDGDAGDDTGTVVATDGHPFWVENHGAWVDAKDLRPGDMLRTSAGTWVQVQAVWRVCCSFCIGDKDAN